MTARDVPPRQYAAGKERCDDDMSRGRGINQGKDVIKSESTYLFLFVSESSSQVTFSG